MGHLVLETTYPASFRKEDCQKLGQLIQVRHSVVLVGIKKAGIANFLRFFLNHPDITKKYLKGGGQHLFIPVDLYGLVEREIYPFWVLTLKRIVDSIMDSGLNPAIKKDVEGLFLDSLQSKDLFSTIDNIRKAILKIVDAGFFPTIFYLRFDRMKEAASCEMFDNLRGLIDATHRHLNFIFTSLRGLDELSPQVFTRPALLHFAQEFFIQPVVYADSQIIFDLEKKRFNLDITKEAEQALLQAVGGHIQYLQLAFLALVKVKRAIKDKKMLLDILLTDEDIMLQSEELWESLTDQEKEILKKVVNNQKISPEEKIQAKYLWNVGMVQENQGKWLVFSSLLNHYISNLNQEEIKTNGKAEFSKKEKALFDFLEKNLNQVCDRDQIIEAIWPNEEDLGISDWALDRLVARVRHKLKEQKNNFELLTVKTRGFKLIINTPAIS